MFGIEAQLNRRGAGTYIPCALVLEDDPTQRVQFESFPVEDGVSEGYNADYAKTDGRAAEPLGRMWVGGDWQAINISLVYRAGLSFFEIGPPGVAISRMIEKVNWLKAAAFPRTKTRQVPAQKGNALPAAFAAASGIGPVSSIFGAVGQAQNLQSSSRMATQAAEPPYVLFVWGLFMTLRGRVTAWQVRWTGPYDPITAKPHGAEVMLTYQPESGFYPDWYSVRDTGGGKVPSSLVGRLL